MCLSVSLVARMAATVLIASEDVDVGRKSGEKEQSEDKTRRRM